GQRVCRYRKEVRPGSVADDKRSPASDSPRRLEFLRHPRTASLPRHPCPLPALSRARATQVYIVKMLSPNNPWAARNYSQAQKSRQAREANPLPCNTAPFRARKTRFAHAYALEGYCVRETDSLRAPPPEAAL